MEKGYIIFTVTTANGSVPIEGARIVLNVGEKQKESITKADGICHSFEFDYCEDKKPFLEGTAKITADGYQTVTLEKIIIYKNVTTVRIVNLNRI